MSPPFPLSLLLYHKLRCAQISPFILVPPGATLDSARDCNITFLFHQVVHHHHHLHLRYSGSGAAYFFSDASQQKTKTDPLCYFPYVTPFPPFIFTQRSKISNPPPTTPPTPPLQCPISLWHIPRYLPDTLLRPNLPFLLHVTAKALGIRLPVGQVFAF